MEILKDIKQIINKINSIFNIENIITEQNFLKEQISQNTIDLINKNSTNTQINKEDIESLSDLIFQLKNYEIPVSNTVIILLSTKNYEAIFYFIKKMLLGQFGNTKYTSKNNYNIIEKFFDRFIEVVYNYNIEKNLYIPFIIKILNSEKNEIINQWIRPASEFMENFFEENENWLYEYLKYDEENKYKLLNIILNFDIIKGIKIIIDDFLTNSQNLEKIAPLLKNYKKEIFFELDNRLYDENISDFDKDKLCNLYLIFESDNEAITRLNELYTKTKSENLKLKIAEKLEMIKSPEIKNEKQFLYTARRKVKLPQERTLGITFDKLNLNLASGFPASNIVKTYLINVFKEENQLNNLKNLNYLFKVFEKKGLNDFAKKLFEVLLKKQDIKEAKWAIRFCCLLSDENLSSELSNFAIELFKQNRLKEGKYLTECLVYTGKVESLKIITSNYIKDKEWKDKVINIFTQNTNYDLEDILDLLSIDNISEININNEKNRLINAFLNGRKYNYKNFDNLINREPFKTLFKRLIWGEYKNDKLYNAFVLKENEQGINEKSYLLKLQNDLVENFDIQILHTLDLDDRFEKVINNAVENPLFNQFKNIKFEIKSYKPQTTEISNFNGMFVKTYDFIESLKENNFYINSNENENNFQSLINIIPNYEFVCILEFSKPINKNITFSNIGNIYFFKKKDLIVNENKYEYYKNNSLPCISIPPRYFDYCLTVIYQSLK